MSVNELEHLSQSLNDVLNNNNNHDDAKSFDDGDDDDKSFDDGDDDDDGDGNQNDNTNVKIYTKKLFDQINEGLKPIIPNPNNKILDQSIKKINQTVVNKTMKNIMKQNVLMTLKPKISAIIFMHNKCDEHIFPYIEVAMFKYCHMLFDENSNKNELIKKKMTEHMRYMIVDYYTGSEIDEILKLLKRKCDTWISNFRRKWFSKKDWLEFSQKFDWNSKKDNYDDLTDGDKDAYISEIKNEFIKRGIPKLIYKHQKNNTILNFWTNYNYKPTIIRYLRRGIELSKLNKLIDNIIDEKFGRMNVDE